MMTPTVVTQGPITLGTNVFGWTAPPETAPDIIETFLDAGGTHIDTADTYPSWAPGCTGGESESALGSWLAAQPERRNTVSVATKMGQMPGSEGLAEDNIHACVTGSLARLRVDAIDILYFHMDDPKADMEGSVRAVSQLIQEGKIHAFAVSNYQVRRLERLLDVCDRLGAPRPVLYQGQYHLLNRYYYETVLAARLAGESIPFMPHSTLANGFLTGKYKPRGVVPSSGRARIVRRYCTEDGWRVLDVVSAVALERGVSPAAVSLAWVRSRPGVVSPAVSVSSADQLAEVMQDVSLSDDELARLDAASEPYARTPDGAPL